MLSRGLFGVVTWPVFRQGVHGLLLCGGGSDLAEFLSTFCVLHTSVRERERERKIVSIVFYTRLINLASSLSSKSVTWSLLPYHVCCCHVARKQMSRDPTSCRAGKKCL